MKEHGEIIGNGDIASVLKEKEGITFFASGVSNSQEIRETEYQREKDLLLEQDKEKRLVYISSLSVFYSTNRYAEHKREMEELVKEKFPKYTILRVGNITWGDNPNTLINHLSNQVANEEPVRLQNVTRYIANEEEFLYWVNLIPDWNCEMNIPGDRMKIKEIFESTLYSMAFKIEKSVYYHIPKTGGTWVKDAIFYSTGRLDKIRGKGIGGEPEKLRLVGCHQLPTSIKDNEKLFSFTFVRHPLYWYRSFWANRKDRGFAKVFLISTLWDKNFEKFIKNVLREYPEGFVTKLYQYYIGEDGKALDFVGRQENLEDDLIKALTLAGEKFDIDKIKQTEKLNVAGLKEEYKDYFKLSKETERKLLKAESWVINKYYEI